jgi:Ca-activated chloride channel family protein
MSWFKSFGFEELVFISLFILFYGIYIFRIVAIAKKLRTTYTGVFVKVAVRTLFFSLLIIALMGPSFGDAKREIKSVGKDIYIAVDLSQSMNATDIQPSRLERLKFELKNIVSSFSSDRLGLIIFSSEAFIQCPLTYDQNALNLFIETLHTGLVPRTGTDFGPPLRMALSKLDDDENPVSQPKSKIVILISDGEDFGDDTEQIASNVEDAGIKLFTLGIGTERGSRIPSGRGYKKDDQGNEVVTRLESNSLRQLAVKTGGNYFEINETNNDVLRLINKVNQIEGEVRESRQVDVSANKYYFFLLAAFLLLLVDAVTSFKTITI